MKRMLTLALGVVLTASAIPAFAQDNFPDSQENHWAFEALGRMKAAGLLTGYPDGMFRGPRPASRYEMAVALYALYQHLKTISDGLEAQQSQLKAKVDGLKLDGFATKEDVKALQEALGTVQAAIAGMKSWGDDIAALKKMSATFEKELASMGVDLEAVKKGVQDLANRVGAIEKRKLPVNFSGDVNLWMHGGYSNDGYYGITVDGRPQGYNDGDPVGVTKDLQFAQELAVNITGNADTPYKWGGTLVFGNFLEGGFRYANGSSTMFGNQSWVNAGVPFGDATGYTYIQTLWMAMDTSLFGLDFNAKVGRISHKVGPYFFQRPDNTPYMSNERWDNGEWYFDGGIFGFNFGKSKFTMFGGRDSNRFSNNGVPLNTMTAGQAGHLFSPGDFGFSERPRGYGYTNGISVDAHLGATLNIPFGEKGGFNLAYLVLDSNSTTNLGNSMFANRAIVFGGDLNYMFSDRLSLNAGYSQSNLNLDSATVIDRDNAAWWAKLGYKADKWGFSVGYRSIDPQFYAPGSWGRIGIWWNPTDIQGFNAMFHYNINDRLTFGASGGFYEGRETTINGIAGLTSDDTIAQYKVHLNYKVNEAWDLMVGGEFVNWKLIDRGNFVGGKPRENWYNVGLKYRMGENAFWSFLWQTSDYNGKNVAGFSPFGGSDMIAKGGGIFSQIGIKY